MQLRAYVRTGGVTVRLLLVGVLVLGVSVMHTLGHPADASGSAHADVIAHAAPHAAPDMPDGHAAPDMPDGHAAPDISDGHAAAGHGDGMGTDMSTLCLAVLTTWALATLLYAAFGRRHTALAPLLAAAIAALRPRPPPPRAPDLAQLSVLRI